jgi:hypothetical protein
MTWAGWMRRCPELDRDTTDFLNRPADQERRLFGDVALRGA